MVSSALSRSIAKLGRQVDDYKKGAVPLSVPVGSLQPYARQARTVFQEAGLQELADSIKAVGIASPLLVRPIDADHYEIIAGERRWRAAQMAGLEVVPVLVKTVDDELADRLHLIENIQRENLSNADLARRVQVELDAAGGNLAVVCAKMSKSKSWVSKLSSIARGGDAMAELIADNVTADRAVLATVASIERQDPVAAQAVVKTLKAAAPGTSLRDLATKAVKGVKSEKAVRESAERQPAQSGGSGDRQLDAEPRWRTLDPVERKTDRWPLIGVELSPNSTYASEFAKLSRKHGDAHLAPALRHPTARYAVVSFGETGKVLRVYKAEELRLTFVDEAKSEQG
jgi:ParB family transcriptional regulator, chromosome partitioning protein